MKLIFFICFCHFLFPLSYALNSSCPINFDYVKTCKWDTSLCTEEPLEKSCCQTLRSLFGIGLAKHLKETSMFYLPNEDAALSCTSAFKAKLSSMSISQSFISKCMNETNDFVVKPSSCGGIVSMKDWMEKVGPNSLLDSSCTGDLGGLTRCSLCVDAGMKVNTYLVSLNPNSTNSRCFYFTVLYAAAIVSEFGPEDPGTAGCVLALPLANKARRSHHLSTETLLKLVFGFLGAFFGILGAIGFIILYKKWDKKRKQDALHQGYVTSVKSQILPNTGAKWFQIGELEQATKGFSQRNMIGQGGSGSVYKGTLSDGTLIAVKKILDMDSKGDEEFINEAEIISKIRHRNLIPLRGFCVTSDNLNGKGRYLVYDFMPNGSLDDHLFNVATKRLSWPQRKNIILDVAKGLAYLHYGIKPSIYHRDIKATNILLDTEMKARVADFGLAKQSKEGQTHLTTRVAGTYGYLAPEYGLYGQLTEKSDVYSFGIVILEIMSGRRVLDASNSSALLITDWAWTMVKSRNVEGVFDVLIREEGPKRVMERFVHVGILCAHVMVALRPTTEDALRMLEGDIDIPRLPDRPLPLGFESVESYSLHSDRFRDISISSSSNSLSRYIPK
ncbi:probable receptor-like protein kinase At1g11050 [Lycium ferocissimum]|uniref:probable receptor-like protein kinase At1g11050 n=1 Tax=Lycium ferocissimum TaxID=112874 RepID=UPI002816172E|nr:probable receptor-like protein kinase At1g11050 [Lycium ferocissimum]